MTNSEEAALLILAQAINDAICDRIEEGHMESREIAARVVTTKTVRDAFLRLAPPGGWNTDLSAMPAKGHFEALQHYPEVFRHMPDSREVVWPSKGRMFVPHAWRPTAVSQGNGD